MKAKLIPLPWMHGGWGRRPRGADKKGPTGYTRGAPVFLIDSATLLLLAFAVYLNSLWVNFLWDDIALVLDNPLIKSFSHILKIFTTNLSVHSDKFYRPLQNLTYAFDFFLFKFDYRGYHSTSILLHALVAILFYTLLRILGAQRKLSLCASLLFLVCPLWVESVAYIAGRADILMAIFILLSFIFFIRQRLTFSVLWYLCALMSKEAGLAYPFVLLLYIFIFPKDTQKNVLKVIFFFIVSLLYLFIRFTFLKASGIIPTEFSFFTRLLIAVRVLTQYFFMILLPLNQHMSHATNVPQSFFTTGVVVPWLIFLGVVWMFIYYVKKESKINAFFIGWFLIFFVPQSGIVPINAFFSEHFIYIASLGIFANAVYLLQRVKSKAVFNLVFFGYMSFYSIATVRYNFIWQDPVKLYRRIIKLSPDSVAVYNNLAVISLDRGNGQEAEVLLSQALAKDPGFSEARLNLARLYYLRHDLKKAIGLARAVLEKEPNNAVACNYLGTFYLKDGQDKLAEDFFKKAVSLNPRHVPFRLDLYLFYKTQGKLQEAEEVIKGVEHIDRYSLWKAYCADARFLLSNNRLDEALVAVNKAVALAPHTAVLYNLKGCILKDKGDYQDSLLAFTKAISLAPLDWESYNNFGNLYARIGDFYQAERNFKKAISLKQDFADAFFNLGLLYFEHNRHQEARRYFEQTLLLNPSYPFAKEYVQKLKLQK